MDVIKKCGYSVHICFSPTYLLKHAEHFKCTCHLCNCDININCIMKGFGWPNVIPKVFVYSPTSLGLLTFVFVQMTVSLCIWGLVCMLHHYTSWWQRVSESLNNILNHFTQKKAILQLNCACLRHKNKSLAFQLMFTVLDVLGYIKR